MNRLSITASVLLCSFALTSKVYAQEIKFETADGKFKITGIGWLLRSQRKAC